MSLQDPISDMLTRIRNGQKAGKANVVMPSSKLKTSILKVMKSEGYITDFSVDEALKPTVNVELKYHRDQPVIEMIKRISKPGLRNYSGKDSLPEVMDGLGIAIVSTSKGVMSGRAASALGEGGEVLCYIA